MNCDGARQNLTLYLYGEMDFNEEESLERHLDGCAACRTTLERERELHAAMDRQEFQPSAELLTACRRELQARVAVERVANRPLYKKLWDWWRGVLPAPAILRPIGMFAMVAMGFFGGKLWEATRGMTEPSVLRVRNFTPSPEGGVQLTVEEVRQKTMTGRLDDDRIQRMLLSAATDPSDAGLRVRTMELLKDRCERSDVRRALLHALRSDPNPGVRLKALEGLKPYNRDPETRRVLSSVLLADDNPGVRTMAIDLLADNMAIEVTGTLQELLVRENNPYIRQKSLQALRERNASLETF
ncbi:MAG: HEAT repeat domain-containing protein [Acidobacteria bacterium]|nr:HEAT repeat domain-containing protein [Acidobacteriota bacterium]